jgi:hypothetical protein
MKKYIFKTKRNNGNKKVMIYRRNFKLLKALSSYKAFLVNSTTALRNENGEYDANLALEHIRKNAEMLNKVLSEGDKIYKKIK